MLKVARISRTQPKKVEDQTGVAFVSILFGVVVGLIVIELAAELQIAIEDFDNYRGARLAHLSVAVVLTVFSFIGYYGSTNRPQHRIYFFNLPLGLFVLDVLMVFDYYVIFQFAESASNAAIETSTSALPESVLVLIALVLYAIWDWVALKIATDEEYQKEIGKEVDSKGRTKPRRVVTQVFTMVAALLLIVVMLWNPTADNQVILVDVVLIAILFLYRVAKPLFDPTVATRAGT